MRPERSQPERTGREDRRSKFYEISDNLSRGQKNGSAVPACRPNHKPVGLGADELLIAHRDWHELRDRAGLAIAGADMQVAVPRHHGLEAVVQELIDAGNHVASPLPCWASVEAANLGLLGNGFHVSRKARA